MKFLSAIFVFLFLIACSNSESPAISNSETSDTPKNIDSIEGML